MTKPAYADAPASESNAASALTRFVACAQQMLDPATPETQRRQAETHLLAQLPVLRALGVFELFQVRDPALAALLDDELEQLASLAGARHAGHHAALRKHLPNDNMRKT